MWYKKELPTPEFDLGEVRKVFVGEVQALVEDIEENIDGYDVTDETLKGWAKQLVSAINESDEISEELSGVIVSILKKESACNTRLRNGYKVIHNKKMLARWHNLRLFICGAFPSYSFEVENLSKEVLVYCKEIGLIDNAKLAFRLKYGEYIEDMDAFFAKTETIKARELKEIYNKRINGSGIKGKEFLDDFWAVAPERKEGANRITYNNYKTN